jgi:hypothetical protein
VPKTSGAGWGALFVVLVLVALGVGGYWLVKRNAKPATARAPVAAPPAVATPAPATPPPVVAATPAPPVAEARRRPEPVAAPPAPAPMPATPAPVVARSAESYPGLASLNLSGAVAAGDPDRQRLQRATQWAIATGDWSRHFDALQNILIVAASPGSATQRGQNLERIVALGTPGLVLEQAHFIRRVGAGTLKTFCAEPENREFLAWLLARPAILTAFNRALCPEDKAGDALAQWRLIWSDDAASREPLAALAIACALVFDEPVKINARVFGIDKKSESLSDDGAAAPKQAAALTRFRFYRDSARKGALKTPLAEMSPWELMWVVDAPVPESELVWAQKNVNFSRRDWGKAYGHIRYRMDKATQGVNPYQAYTLAEIEKEGGVCADQAYFAAMTAKANGIPAMVISGEGDRGAHAWVGYESGRNEWNLTTGRYAGDSYAAGTTSHPQTRARIKEHELKQLTDPVRRTAGWQKSESLLAFAALASDPAHRDLAAAASDAALQAAPRNFDAWTARLDRLAAQKPPTAEWLKESARMRTIFREYSDLVQRIDQREADYLAATGDTAAARKLVSLQTARMERKDAGRTDLILDSVAREAELAGRTGGPAAVGRVYRDALKSKGEEVVGFKKIAAQYYDWGRANGQGPATVRDLVSFFDRHHTEPTRDTFAMGAFRGVLRQLTAMAQEQGQTDLQRRLERREAKMKELEDKQGKLQSRGADR